MAASGRQPLFSVTAEQMRHIDRVTVQKFGMPELLLMENAGRAVAEVTHSMAGRLKGSKVVVLTGGGHNGCDGVVAARYLHNWGYEVQVLWLRDPSAWEGDRAVHYRIAKRCGVKLLSFERLPPNRRVYVLRSSTVLVDALLGTGVGGEVRSPFREAIASINNAHRPVIAVDIPSGLDADNGTVNGIGVKATTTVTMGFSKVGLLKPWARPYVGRLLTADIGFPSPDLIF